jgi:hypothetical protein
MPRPGKQTELMRKDGYLLAVDVARGIGIDLSTAHEWIKSGKMPGQKFSAFWYVSIHDFYASAKTSGDFSPTVLAKIKEMTAQATRPRTRGAT